MPKATKTRRKLKPGTTEFWQGVIDSVKEMSDVLATGGLDEVERRYKVVYRRAYFDRPAFTPAEIIATREAIGAPQFVFASMLGVSTKTVQAWERGTKSPSNTALRFLYEIRRDPDYWKPQIRTTEKPK